MDRDNLGIAVAGDAAQGNDRGAKTWVGERADKIGLAADTLTLRETITAKMVDDERTPFLI